MKLNSLAALLTLSVLSVAHAGGRNLCDDLYDAGNSSSEQIKKCQEKFGVSDTAKARVAADKLKSEQKPSILLKALFSVFGTTFALEALFLIGEFTNMLPPLILKTLIDSYKTQTIPDFIEKTDIAFLKVYRNYFVTASLLIFAIQLFTIFSLNTYFMISRYMGIKIRTSISGLVYQKSLLLTCAARQVNNHIVFMLI